MGWLLVFFVVAFYAVVSVGFGNVNTLYQPIPYWNPLDWNFGYMIEAIQSVLPGGQTWPVVVRTAIYIGAAITLSLLIGYPVAYYASRHAGRWRGLVVVLLILPFWISYIMRMYAWTNLLAPDGYGSKLLSALSIDSLLSSVGLLDGTDWLGGQGITVILALVYGYVPFMILPLFASLDRIDQRVIEAARDLGAPPESAFRRVILPLSKPGILAGLVLVALPMAGDYYTQTLMSASPATSMIGNTINDYIQGGPEKPLGAAMTMLLSAVLLMFMLYYLRTLRREQGEVAA
ncbi:MAG: ABC transporter permease [Solirubrobacteraceae bacterium]|jgi:putrescine transport system permease protein|nr:ABC transporter permease [Solirubrobacteraceae bacterium]MDP4921418.1 ABC transporter permease [Solirubrobacteraceae bacterium]